MRNPARYALALGALLGAALGLLSTYTGPAQASRNSAGTYSLPSGNPVVSGTTITSSWANNTLSDLGAEVTNSLDRQGRGAMLSPLQLASGSAGAPGLTFSADPDTGLYRAGAGDVRLQVDATQSQRWSSTGTVVAGTLDVGGAVDFASTLAVDGTLTVASAVTASAGMTITQPAAGNNALTATGNNTGNGVYGVGGTGSSGVYGTGGQYGVYGLGVSLGAGVGGLGAGSGPGGSFTGGAGGGVGVAATGGATAAGATLSNGTAATAATRRDAATLGNGDLNLGGVADPATTTAVSDRLTPSNIVKTWAKVTTNGFGGATVAGGFNVTSAAVAGAGSDDLRLTWASAFASADYACTVTLHDTTDVAFPLIVAQTTTTLDVRAKEPTTGATMPFDTTALTVHVVCVGAQ